MYLSHTIAPFPGNGDVHTEGCLLEVSVKLAGLVCGEGCSGGPVIKTDAVDRLKSTRFCDLAFTETGRAMLFFYKVYIFNLECWNQ